MANIEAYGTNIVGSGGSGGGGLTQEEHEWLESLAAYEPNMYDVNTSLVDGYNQDACYSIHLTYSSSHWANPGENKLPVCGYKRLKYKLSGSSYSSFKFRFQLADGTYSEEFTASSNNWSDWVTIPEGAIGLGISNKSGTYVTFYYSLSTSES